MNYVLGVITCEQGARESTIKYVANAIVNRCVNMKGKVGKESVKPEASCILAFLNFGKR
jgi:hypothetical protein